MAAIKEIATQAQSGAFDTARRLVKTQEDVLGAFEDYQGSVLKDIRTPWAAVKANYGLVKQLASIQSDLALEWAAGFARMAQQSVRKATKPASA